MRAGGVVVPPELLNLESGIGEVEEPVGGETLVAEPAVEAFDVGVLDRLARTNELELDAVTIGPDVERPRDALRLVVAGPNRPAGSPPESRRAAP